jgi:hypothetical protein
VAGAEVVGVGFALGAQLIEPDLRIGVHVGQRGGGVIGATGSGAESGHAATVGHDSQRSADPPILDPWTACLPHPVG